MDQLALLLGATELLDHPCLTEIIDDDEVERTYDRHGHQTAYVETVYEGLDR